MLETAAVYIIIAIGKKLIDHAGEDAGDAFDKSLGKLARWVKQKFADNQTGKLAIAEIAEASAGEDGEAERKQGSKYLIAALKDATANDPKATRELEALVAEVQKVTPPELILNGTLRVKEVLGGKLIGVKTVGDPHVKTTATAIIEIDKMTGGETIGVSHENSRPS
jgi:hypothetical protein